MSSVQSVPISAQPIKGKVLVVLSSEDHITLANNKDQPTGFFLPELVKPVIKLLDAGYAPVFANPKGNAPSADPLSESLPVFLFNFLERNREQAFVEKLKNEARLSQPFKLADITDADLETFKGILIPGGHAPMQDLHDDKDLGRILKHFHDRSKPTGTLCHGPIALLSTRTVGPFLYAGYKVSCYSDREESMNEVMFRSALKFKVQSELEKAGAIVEVNPIPMGTKVVIDKEVVSAQGFTSAQEFGEKLAEAVVKYDATAPRI
ncbi:class I glutamine amidotransferase-like protein [Fimicolochytrium jonesii]|uniref:class I glutamine amidotransferase-like protein n=1 Tax=Fimicolochytrium jonesii TaxID=1396493 RepID=UPI0022FF19F6|nr:class I glutamine amidotransferase-like protein [Fimicolochytrium jonesii]KAI8817584.1 class I glutamine amidotransferase-like protein [Fimicolochytrium jonesii]